MQLLSVRIIWKHVVEFHAVARLGHHRGDRVAPGGTSQGEGDQSHQEAANREEDHILDLQAALVLLDARLEKTHGGPDDFLKLPPVEKMDHDRDADRGQSCKHDGV